MQNPTRLENSVPGMALDQGHVEKVSDSRPLLMFMHATEPPGAMVMRRLRSTRSLRPLNSPERSRVPSYMTLTPFVLEGASAGAERCSPGGVTGWLPCC